MGNTQMIYQAAKRGNLRRLQMWIRRYPKRTVGVVVNLRTDGMTPLTVACREGHVDVVEYLLDECGAHIELAGWETSLNAPGAQPLWWATHQRHLSVVRSLVTRGAHVNCRTPWGITPLMQACIQGDLQIVKYLVTNGADVGVVGIYERTAVAWANEAGHHDIACYLIHNGAHVSSGHGTAALQSLNLRIKRLK